MNKRETIIKTLNTTGLEGTRMVKGSVEYELKDAEVISAKVGHFYPTSYHPRYRRSYGTKFLKVVVKDPEIGVLYFSTYSDKLWSLEKGDKVSLKVLINGVGDATDRYPDPILFAKAQTRKRDSVTITKKIADDSAANELPINV